MTVCPIIIGLEHITDLNKPLLDWAKEVEARLDLSLGVVSLHCGGDHGNEPTLARHLSWINVESIMIYEEHLHYLIGCRHHGDIDI